MAFELSVYTSSPPLPGADVMALAHTKKIQLRLVVPFRCIALDNATLRKPLKKQDLMVYCWPVKDVSTSVTLDEALSRGDTRAILSVQDRIGWFDFRCERFSYERFWKKHPREKDAFEESSSEEALQRMRSAKVRYFFRCGLRPKQNAKYLQQVATLLRDTTEGYLGE